MKYVVAALLGLTNADIIMEEEMKLARMNKILEETS